MARVTFLLITDFDRLEEWARKVRILRLGFPLWLVGSALTRPDYRDVDIRAIFTDQRFDAEWGDDIVRVRFMNQALSTWGQRETGLPIDFQIQRMTEAGQIEGARHPLGNRDWDSTTTSGIPVASGAE